MELTPMQRRQRIYALAEENEDCAKAMEAYETARLRFEKRTARLPKRLRSRLWEFPGMGYFIHHRMLTIICSNMKFPDELE